MSVSGEFKTIMTGLRCGKVSPIAWPTISKAVDAFVSIEDEQCASAMRLLAYSTNDDPSVTAGASGACGLAAMLPLLGDQRLLPIREALGLNAQSRVFVINTEGATDPSLYAQIVGRLSPKNT